ncbi:protein kinase domain-containing protein [Alkalihalobacterium elongatum]|uniref:protein kinase domain-containing protein n=1 Tax=Alkalihalobacterium elongatum TaxID=2675466 RepID=UPI001C1F46F9|nr:phosphotransferase [Alkalihalobacterium elongatum]
MNYSKTQACNLNPGTTVIGKWHKKKYQIVKLLGSGATGSVYLARCVEGEVALKIGVDSMAITSEVNVLKHFSKVQGQVLGPSLLDVDDLVTNQGVLPFYVMEYLKGEQLITFTSKRGEEWIGILMVQLLGDLDRLHRAGWAFGDLKPDNLIVVGPTPRIRWLDVGGTTLLGRSIKEYTEFFDRGYWGLGSRVAEPSYDLFSLVMIMINCSYPKRFDKKGEQSLQQLKQAIEMKPGLKPYRDVMVKGLQGKYGDAQMMKKDVMTAIQKKSTHYQKSKPSHPPRTQRKVKKKSTKPSYWIEIFLVISFIILAYILYLFGQLM